MNTFIKGYLMALVGFVAATISDLEVINLAYVGITGLSFTVLYLVQNAVIPSNSNQLTLALIDWVKGLGIAISMAISSFAGSILTTGAVDWNALWVAVVAAFVGYISKTFAQDGKSVPKTKKKKL